MFGKYALCLEGRLVALVCGNPLFMKPAGGDRQLLGRVDEHPSCPGGKPWFRIGEDLDGHPGLPSSRGRVSTGQ